MGQRLQRTEESGLPAEVASVRALIEAWRRTRPRMGPMPEELWDAAVSLVGQHGLYRISRDLAVDYGALQTRVAQAMADEEDPGAGLDGFVEVSPGMLERHADLGGAVLELTRADGTRMELRLPAHEAVDVVGLVAAFAGNGA